MRVRFPLSEVLVHASAVAYATSRPCDDSGSHGRYGGNHPQGLRAIALIGGVTLVAGGVTQVMQVVAARVRERGETTVGGSAGSNDADSDIDDAED